MAGAVDLFAGRQPIAGINLFKSDKNPLNQLDMGIEDVMGRQGQSAGTQVTALTESLVQAILGLTGPLSSVTGEVWTGTWTYVNQFFGDIEKFFAIGGGLLGTNGFDLSSVVNNFIQSNLWPENLLGPMDPATQLLHMFNIPGLDATKIVSGQFPQSQITNLESDLANLGSAIASGDVQGIIDAILGTVGFPPGTGTAPDVASYFTDFLSMFGNPALTAGGFDPVTAVEVFLTDLVQPTKLLAPMDPLTSLVSAVHIPGLDTTKIVSGVFPQSMVNITSIPASVVSGILAAANIPGLDATKIVSGQFPQSMVNITSIAASLVTGVLTATNIPGLDATKIVTGILALGQIPGLDVAHIPSLPAGQITSGTFLATLIPGLDATKIVSGVLATGLIPNITKAMSTDMQSMIDGIFQASNGGATTGNTVASVKTSLLNIPGVNIVTTLLASVIPSLDATKVTTGQFPQSMLNITSIAAGIVTGTLGAGQIPGLDATKIVSGVLGLGQIPPLDASQITTGQFPQWLLPLVPVSSIGQTTPNLLANPNYASSIAVAGQGIWIYDGTQTHTAEGSGSVKVIANGTLRALNSDPATPVSQGQILNLSHWLMWSGVSGVGACMQLSLQSYLAGQPVNSTVIQAVTSPAASSAWTQLSGTYTVPAGVDAVRLQLQVLPACTTGTINWDDASLTKTNLLQQSWTQNLVGDMSNMTTQIIARALQTDVVSLVNTLGLGSFADVPSSITSITNRLTNVAATGTFNSAFLSNMANHPLLPTVAIPSLDATKIASGIMAIAQIPTGQLNRTNITDLGSVTDHLMNGLFGAGSQYASMTPTQSRAAMDSIYSSVLLNTQNIQAMRSVNTGTDVSGTSVTVNFNQYPDGGLPSNFTTVYSGVGTSSIGITSGQAGWRVANNDGNRNAMICYNAAPTNTDFQIVRGTLASAPPGASSGGTPRIAACGRVNNPANPTTYVWARGYCTGFLTYKGDIGCTVNGVETVWASNIPLTWSMDISMVFGVGGNPRRYQVYSGQTLVYDYTEVGTTSGLGAGFRYWGCRTEIKTGSNGANPPPAITSTSVSDNQAPTINGSSFRASRRNVAQVAASSGTNRVPVNFFDTQEWISSDMTWDGLNLTINTEGSYLVHIRYGINNIPTSRKADCAIYQNNAVDVLMGGAFADSYVGNSADGMEGLAIVYINQGDTIQPGYYYSAAASNAFVGDSNGVSCYFEVALLNRSFA
jgi:hypothetical protein